MSFYEESSIIITPNAYKAGTLYAVVPTSGLADMDVTRATAATRVDEDGLVADVLSGVPRIDYTGGGCPHILAEPQRTNRIVNSEDGSTWSLSNLTLSSLSGGLNKEYYQIKSLGNTGRFDAVSNSWINTTASTYTASVFAKKGTTDEIILTSRASLSTQDTYSVFNLTNGTVVSNNIVAGSIESYSDGWYKCSITFTNSGGYTNFASFAFGFNFNSTDTDTLFVAAPQSEIGSYPTSYIPTSGATVTRNQDEFTRDGISSLINSEEGVFFAEIAALSDDGTNRIISLSDGTTTNRVSLILSTTANTIRAMVVSDSVTFDEEHAVTSVLDYNKIAIKYKENDFALWINGVEVDTDNSGNTPTGLNKLSFDVGISILDFFGKVKQLQVYPTALSDSELTILTTL